MSAKEFYHKDSPSYIPYLPPELWSTIIQHATLVPGGYDPDLTTLAFNVNANTMNKERLKVWKKALVTRRYLVRVSKTWHALAAPFLYEYILLERGKAVGSLLCGMERSQRGIESEDSTRPIGWWTKRLDVNLRDSTGSPRAVMDALAGVVTHLPNLRILTFSITGHQYRQRLSPNVLRSVSCCETLKFVHFYTTCLPSTEIWSRFLEQHPYLESVNLNDPLLCAGRYHIRLDFLQTVHINMDTTYLIEATLRDSSWQAKFPAVRTATYDLEFSCDETQAVHLFTDLGPRLTTIQLTQLQLVPENVVEVEANLQLTFDSIMRECQALEQINLLFCSWSILKIFIPCFPPKVATLVIRIIKVQVSKKTTVQLFHEIFTGMKARNPNLKTIQFCSGMNVRGLRTHSRALAEGVRLMNEIGVVIKDDEGSVM